MHINWSEERNLTMLTDYYEFTMSNGYFLNGMKDKVAVFDMFFRNIPDNGGFAIFAGLEQLVHYLENLRFTPQDIEYFRSKKVFDEQFLDYLANFRFSCDVWAMEEGTPIFPNEPIVTVKGPVIQAQLVETMILLTINHQSLVATKANRMVRAAGDKLIMEFGSRRAQGYDAAILGARATYIGGCGATACAITDRDYGVPAVGTMAHSWVQMFDSEYEAFKSYAQIYPDDCTLLVDTYNVLKSGIPNAIKVFNEVILPLGHRPYEAFKSYAQIYPDDCTLLVDTYNVLKSGIPNAIKVFNEVILPLGHRPKGVRIDSGDIAYLSKKARKMLDEAGFADVKIVASNSLDEYIIRDLQLQGAKLDSFGIGERLITSKSDPVFGGVYKLVAVEKDGEFIPKIKVSESPEKITNPHFKKVYRLFDSNGKAVADYVCVHDEQLDTQNPITLTIFDPLATWKKCTLENVTAKEMLQPIFRQGKLVYHDEQLDTQNPITLTIFDPLATWKKCTLENVTAKEMLQPIFRQGKLVYQLPDIQQIRSHCKQQVDTLWDEVKRFENPHNYYVDLSQKLWDIKNDLLAGLQQHLN